MPAVLPVLLITSQGMIACAWLPAAALNATNELVVNSRRAKAPLPADLLSIDIVPPRP
jgi:hypothetical protein